MKVAYVLSQNSGGLPHYAAELANAVTEYADVIVLKPTETTADDVFSDDVEVINAFETMQLSIPELYKGNINPIDNLRSLLSYRHMKSLRDLDPDVVHDPTGFFPQVRLFSGLYDIGDRFPLVVTYHEIPPDSISLSRSVSTEELFSSLFYTTLTRALPSVRITKRIVHGEEQRTALARQGASTETTDVIPHGVYEFFGDYDYEERPEEENTVLFFGNLLPAKGIEVLLRAILMVADEIPDVKLLVAGNGRLSKRARTIIADNPERFEVHDHFIPNDQVGTFFSRAQVVALPYKHQGSETKGHSGVLSTAFSFGKPVVATTVGGFPDLVENHETGLVVPSNDPRALAEGIVELLRDDDLRERLAANSARQTERLSWDNVAKQHLETYRNAISSHRSRM